MDEQDLPLLQQLEATNTQFVSPTLKDIRHVWEANSPNPSFLLVWNYTIQPMLNTRYFVWHDKTETINQIHTSSNVTAGFRGYWIIHVNSQGSFPIRLKKNKTANCSGTSLNVEFETQLSSFQFLSLPVKLFGNKEQAGCNQKDYIPSHSSLNST